MQTVICFFNLDIAFTTVAISTEYWNFWSNLYNQPAHTLFKQTFWPEKFPYLYLFALNLLSLVEFGVCIKKYRALRFVFIAWFAVISIIGMIQYLSNENIPYLISAFFSGLIVFIISSMISCVPV